MSSPSARPKGSEVRPTTWPSLPSTGSGLDPGGRVNKVGGSKGRPGSRTRDRLDLRAINQPVRSLRGNQLAPPKPGSNQSIELSSREGKRRPLPPHPPPGRPHSAGCRRSRGVAAGSTAFGETFPSLLLSSVIFAAGCSCACRSHGLDVAAATIAATLLVGGRWASQPCLLLRAAAERRLLACGVHTCAPPFHWGRFVSSGVCRILHANTAVPPSCAEDGGQAAAETGNRL